MDQLAMTERHVAMARRNVERQREIVIALAPGRPFGLARDGHSAERAADPLRLYERLMDQQLEDRERLRGQLFALRQPSNSRLSSGWSRDTQR